MNGNWERVRNAMREFGRNMQEERHDREWSPNRNGDGQGYSYGGNETWRNRDYGYSPQNAIGFNSNQQYNQQREYGRHHQQGFSQHGESFEEQMEQYFRDIKSGRIDPPAEMCEMMAMAASECSHSGNSSYEEEEHERYKDAIERLREAPPNEKQKLIKELFENDLTRDEQIVLNTMAEMKSYKRLASEKGITLERYKDAKKSLKHKLKQ